MHSTHTHVATHTQIHAHIYIKIYARTLQTYNRCLDVWFAEVSFFQQEQMTSISIAPLPKFNVGETLTDNRNSVELEINIPDVEHAHHKRVNFQVARG